MQRYIRLIKKFLMRLILLPLRLVPIKSNRVLIINDLGYNYAGNPKAVAEYLDKKGHSRYEIVYSVNEPERYVNLKKRGFIMVKFNSSHYFYYAMTSKVIITNSGGTSYIPLRKCQCLINTGHGGGAYKKMGVDMFDNSFAFRTDLKMASRQIDFYLSTCKRYSEVVSKSVLIPKNKFWEIGMPRNDILLNRNDEIRQSVRKELKLLENEKLVLFAPTYRKIDDNYYKESVGISYGIDSERVCRALRERFGGEWRFAIRFHPCVINSNELKTDDMQDLSDFEDMQELLCAADVMINDFSSSMWDFMLTGRPCFLFALDLKHYEETTKVYTPVSEWPFPKAVNNDELEKNILEFDEANYHKECKKHYHALGGCETGQATALVCEKIYKECYES